MSERLAMIESNSNVCRLFLRDYFVKCIAEAEYRWSIESLGINAWVGDERIIGTINQRVGVDKK